MSTQVDVNIDRVLVEQAAVFTAGHITPYADDWELSRLVPEAALRQAAAQFGGLLAPRDQGGLGASVATAAAVLAELARGDLAFAFSLVVHANLTNALARSGSTAQRDKYLTKLLSGSCYGAFCLTEAGAGTDAASIETSARKQGDRWLLSGQKAWVTNAAFANLLSVYAKLPLPGGKNAGSGASQIATFLVDANSSGVQRLPAYQLLGSHIMGTGGFLLQDCQVSEQQMLFPPGEGFKAAMAGIDLARVLLSGMCCGLLEQALETAIAYARERQAFGQSILGFQGLQWQLAETATQLEASRLLTDKAIALLERGEAATLAAAHAKKFVTRATFEGISAAMQVMGAAGLRRDCPLPRQLANARAAQYLDGTTEVQNIVISRRLQ